MTTALPRAVFVGDSQLEGLASHLRAAFDGQLQIVGVTALPGASTRVVVDSGKVRDLVSSQHPDVVVFVLGGNDTAGAAAHQATADAVRQAQAGGAEVWWIGPALARDPETNTRHAGTSAMQAELVPQLGAHWLDSRAWANEGWGPDDVHFTRDAYTRQAAALARAMRPGPGTAVIVGGVLLGAALLAGAAVVATHYARD